MARPKIGDVIEIEVRDGLAYAQYTHQHHQYGGVLRVFDERFAERPSDFRSVVELPLQLTTCFPLRAALRQGIFEIVAHEPIRDELQPFPVFRAGMANPKTKRIETWWLWDGENETRVEVLTPEQLKLPVRGVLNDTLLIHRINEGWRAEVDGV